MRTNPSNTMDDVPPTSHDSYEFEEKFHQEQCQLSEQYRQTVQSMFQFKPVWGIEEMARESNIPDQDLFDALCLSGTSCAQSFQTERLYLLESMVHFMLGILSYLPEEKCAKHFGPDIHTVLDHLVQNGRVCRTTNNRGKIVYERCGS